MVESCTLSLVVLSLVACCLGDPEHEMASWSLHPRSMQDRRQGALAELRLCDVAAVVIKTQKRDDIGISYACFCELIASCKN